MRTILFSLALAFAPLLAFSQALPSVVFPAYTNGNVTTIGPATADASNAAKFRFGAASNGSIFAAGDGYIPTAGGKSIPITATATVSGAAVGKALVNFVRRVATPLAVGSAVWDLAKELRYALTRQSDDSVSVALESGGYTWSVNTGSSVFTSAVSADAVCRLAAPAAASVTWTTYGSANGYAEPGNTGWCMAYPWGPSGQRGAAGRYVTYSQTGSAPTSAPSTLDSLESAIAAKSGWPSASTIGTAISQAVTAGEPLAVPAPSSITGPASVLGPTATTTNSDGSTKTVADTYNITYGPSSVTVNQTTVTTNNVGGSATSSTTTAPAPPEVQTCGLPGTPACKIDESGTPAAVDANKYESGAVKYKTDSDAARTTISGSGDKPFFSGWSVFFNAPPVVACQSMVLPGVLGGASVGTIDPCPVVEGVRHVMAYLWAISALFLCLGMIKRGI